MSFIVFWIAIFDWINMSTQVKAPWSQGEGYGVIIGLDGAFALGNCSQEALR
jgi:hypothetical protein